jgi:hypothetical protein
MVNRHICYMADRNALDDRSQRGETRKMTPECDWLLDQKQAVKN